MLSARQLLAQNLDLYRSAKHKHSLYVILPVTDLSYSFPGLPVGFPLPISQLCQEKHFMQSCCLLQLLPQKIYHLLLWESC